jgi:hypothetical protein
MKKVMLDTMILTIANGPTKIWGNKSYWNPSVEGLINNPSANHGARLFTKYICNMPKNKNYYPRLTITSRWNYRQRRYETPLKIEFSAPKILFGNNVNELKNEDFDTFIETLQAKLKEMGVRLFKKELENAPVTVAHFSKNIQLSNNYTPSQVIKTLNKLEIKRQLQLNSKRFQNHGHAIYFDCSSYQIVIYDKVRDLKQTRRHSADKDKINNQLQLFNKLTGDKEEIIRIEVRIVNKQKLNALMKEFDYPTNPTLKDVFNSKLSQSIVNHFWKEITSDKNQYLLTYQQKDPLLTIIDFQKTTGDKFTVAETLTLAHTLQFTKEKGLNGLRNALNTLYSDRTWYRFQKKYVGKLNNIPNQRRHTYIKEIENKLSLFKPYQLTN